MIQAIKRHLKKSGLSHRNKRKDDIIDDQRHNPIEVSNVNDNLSSCYLPIDSKLTDSNVNENQVIQVNCPDNLGHCNNNRINSNHQVKNNNNYNKNNKNQLNNAVEIERHSGHHCSSSVLIGKRENVHHNDEETELIEGNNKEPELDSQNETNLIDDTNQSFQNVGIHEGNDHQSTDCCPVDNQDNLLTSTLVNQVTFKQYESLLPKKALKNENNGPFNNNQLDHLQSTYSCNQNSSNLISQNDHMNLETSLDNRIHSFDHHETSTGDFNDPLSKLLLERIRLLEEENTNLIAESEQQRIQYEKCLDDVAASVVNALLSQKNLRQECVQLRRRVRELEQQNQLLTLVLEEQLVTPSNKNKSDATLINNFNNNHLISIKNKDPLNNTSTCLKDSSTVNSHQIYLTANGSSLLPLSSLGVGKLSSDKLNDNGITNGDDDSNRPARNDNLNYTDSQTNAIINSEYISPCSYLSSTSSSNSLPTSSSSGLSEMARQFEQALSSLLADSTSPKEMAYQSTKALSSSASSSTSSTSSPSSSSNKLPKDSTVLYSNQANFPVNTANEVQSITTSSSFVKPVNTRETIKTRKLSVEQIKMKMNHEDDLERKEKYVFVNDEAGCCWRTSSDRNEVDKEIDGVDGVSGPINCSNGSSTGLRQLARPSRESFLTSLKMEKDSSLYQTSSDFHSLSVNSNGVPILPSSSPSIFSSSLGQGQSMSSSTIATVTSNEPEKLSRKIRESFESECCRSMKRPHYSFNNRNHNVESYKETRSSQYSGNCLSTQSMSEFNSKLGYQSNKIDRREEKIRREDFISSKPRTTITETSTSTITAAAIKTISPSTPVSSLDNKLKFSSSNSIDLTKLKSSPSNQICSLNTSHKKSSSNINLVHNLTSNHSPSSSSSSSSSSLPPSSSLIHSSTSSSFSSALAGSPLSSSSSCSSPKKILFDRKADNAETSNLDSSLFQVNARSNQQEKRILFILASNQPNPSSISSSSSSFSSASSSSSSSFSIEKSSCDNKSINKPINLELRALSSSSSDSKSIPSLDKDSPISGEISSDTNGELVSKDEGYSTMSSDVQSDATISGSSFNSTNNTNTTISSTNTIFPVNPSITKQSTESNSGKNILIEKQNFTTSKPLPLSALVSKQYGTTVEIRSGLVMGVNGSTTPIPMKLSAVNPIVVGSCRLTTFKDLPGDCLIKSTISTQNTSFTSSNDNCNNNNTKMDVLREEEDCIEKHKNKPTEDYNLNSNCSKAAKNGNKSSCSDNCEAHNLNSSHLTRQPYSDIMRKSKKGNHPHRYTFPPTSKAVTVDGIECTPCVVSDSKPSLRADFKSIGFLCNSFTKKSTQSIDSNGWLKSRLIDTTEKVTCTDFCDKDGSIYLNHCIVANNDGVDDVKMNSEKRLNTVDANGDNFDDKIGQTNIKADVVRSRRLTSFNGEMIKQEDKGSDLETDEKGYDDNGIVTFRVGKPGFKRKSMLLIHCNHVNKLGSSASSSSSAGTQSLSRSYSDSQLYSDSKDKIASIRKKRATHETTSTCKPSSGLIRRRAKRDTRACNQSLRWSTLSTSSSALSDGLEAPICYERRRCRPRPADLAAKYISSDENHSADDEDSHEKFVSRWLRNGTGGLRWDDSEVTWKLNESLDWPESMDFNASKTDDNFEEIPLLDDESDKIEIVTSVLPSSKAEIGDNSSDQASSVLDDNLVPETNFNGDFYRLCSVGSKTSLPEVPGLLASTALPLTDVKEHENVPGNDNLSSYPVIKESTNDIGLNKVEIVQRQCLDSNQDDEEILVITTDIVDHSIELSDQQKQSMKPSAESASSTFELPVKSLHHSSAIKIESKKRDENSTKSKTDDKIVIINHIPINPETTKSSSSCTSHTTLLTSPTKSLSPCSSSSSVKSSNSGQSLTDKCKQTKSTINSSTGLKEKKPMKTFKLPIKEPTTIIVNSKNLKENHEENVKEQSTLRDCTERSSENGPENASLSSSSQTRPIPSLIKSHSSNYAKLSSATRIPLPKQSNSLDQIKTNKDIKLKHDTTETGERMNTKNLIAKFSANSKKPIKQELTKSSINNSKISNSDSSHSTGLISANAKKNEEKSEKGKEYIKNVESKRLRSEKSYNRSRKTTDVATNEHKMKSPTAPSVEEFERRLSEDKQMAEKIKEFYSLFEERQSSNVECSSKLSKVNNSDKPILESIQCKLNYPKAILRRPKGEPSKTSKEGHETSWVHVSGFSVGKSENVEKSTSSSSTAINNNKNSTGKLSSDSCSSEDEANFNINGKKRSSFHQRLLALHRSRRQRKRASGRYMGMGFLPRIRASIVDRLDFYHRFGEKEQEALSSFNFLNEFSISPLSSSSSSSSSPVIECFEKFSEEQRLLIRCYLNSFSQLSQSSSLPASCSPPFTYKWPQSPSSSSLKCSPSRHQPSVAENTNYINDSDLNRKTIGTDYVDLITPNTFV